MMAGLVLAGRAAEDAADAAGHAGLAQGITGLMRMIAVHRARGQCFMPADVLARHDMTPAHVLAGRMSEGMRVVIRDLSGIAATHLAAARRLLGAVPPAALPAFLPVSLVDLYLKRLARSNRTLMTAVPEVQQMRRQWHMLKAAFWKEF
jgi:phytoene synthase